MNDKYTLSNEEKFICTKSTNSTIVVKRQNYDSFALTNGKEWINKRSTIVSKQKRMKVKDAQDRRASA